MGEVRMRMGMRKLELRYAKNNKLFIFQVILSFNELKG